MRKAVITGASGYIGSHLAQALLAEGWEVHAILRQQSQLDLLQNSLDKIHIHRHDGQMASMLNIFENIGQADVVFHLAAFYTAKHTWQQVEDLIDSNITLGTMLLEAMALTGSHNLVNTSTVSQHYQEKPYNPMCLYSATKEAFEKIIDYYVQANQLHAISLELFDTYGEDDQRKKLMRLIYDCWKNGGQLDLSPGGQQLDLVYIDDVIAAYLKAAEMITSQAGHHKYMVTSKHPYTLKQIIEMIEQHTNTPLNIRLGAKPYREREMMTLWQAGETLPGWQIKTPLPEGIKQIFR